MLLLRLENDKSYLEAGLHTQTAAASAAAQDLALVESSLQVSLNLERPLTLQYTSPGDGN